jgi:hypothetical protein
MHFEFVEKIPRSLLGKALKKELRQMRTTTTPTSTTSTTTIAPSSPVHQYATAREMA